jgi:hypothetical protein
MTQSYVGRISGKESDIIRSFHNDFVLFHTLDETLKFSDYGDSYAKNISDIALGRHNKGYYLEMPIPGEEPKILRNLSPRHTKIIGLPCVAANANPHSIIPTYDVTENLGFIINPKNNSGLKFLFFSSTDAWSVVHEEKGKVYMEFFRDFCAIDLFKQQLPQKYTELPYDRVKICVNDLSGSSQLVHDTVQKFLNGFQTKGDWYQFANGSEKLSTSRTQINWNEVLISYKGKFSGIFYSPNAEINPEKDADYLKTKAIALAGAYYKDTHQKLPIFEYNNDSPQKLTPITVTKQLQNKMEKHFNENKFVSKEEQAAIFENFNLAILMQEHKNTKNTPLITTSVNIR